MGDMLLRHRDGRILLLDAGPCRIDEIADSMGAFEQAMKLPENAKAWFLTDVLGDLLESGATLADKECFGYKVPPILSGTTEPANFEPTDIRIHFSICGQLGAKSKALPVGTVVNEFTSEEDAD
jgi:T6SS immunity protein Tdi1, C-terminal